MEYLIRQLLLLLEKIRRDLRKAHPSPISDDGKDSEERIRPEHKEQNHNINLRISGELAANLHSDEVSERAQATRHKQNLRPQWITAVSTSLAFLAAAIYAGETSCIVKTTNRTYEEVQKQTYMSCLNMKAAQESAAQSKLTTIDSHVMAIASVQQAAAAIEPQRAHVVVKTIAPTPEVLVGEDLVLPYSVENFGKSATLGIAFTCKAILLKTGEKLSVGEDNETTYTITPLKPGARYPETAEPPYKSVTPFMYVVDTSGKRVNKNTSDAKEYLLGNSGRIAVIAQLAYSDFAGVHHDKFCTMVNIVRQGRIDEANKDLNVAVCQKYNHEEDSYSQIQVPPLPPLDQKIVPDTVCIPPKN